MQNFELYNPVRVIFGAGEVKNLAGNVAGLGRKGVLKLLP